MKIEGLKRVIDRLEKMKSKVGTTGTVSVVTGYAKNYAIFVHENLQAKHGAAWNAAYIKTIMKPLERGPNKGKLVKRHQWTDLAIKLGYNKNRLTGKAKKAAPKNPNQQAKFLEQPARQFAKEVADIVHEGVKKGLTLIQALYFGALFLQRKSQEIVPVDTGDLRGSAFTMKEE